MGTICSKFVIVLYTDRIVGRATDIMGLIILRLMDSNFRFV